MARQLTPFGKVVMLTLKWLIIPLAVALIGFKIFGPMIAGPRPEAKAAAQKRTVPLSKAGEKFQSVREGNRP